MILLRARDGCSLCVLVLVCVRTLVLVRSFWACVCCLLLLLRVCAFWACRRGVRVLVCCVRLVRALFGVFLFVRIYAAFVFASVCACV